MKTDVLAYIVKSVSISGILFLLYILFQRKESTFSFNRFFILSSVLFIIVLPLVHFDTFHILSQRINNYSLFEEPVIEPVIKHQIAGTLPETNMPENKTKENFNWPFIAYILLAAILLVRFSVNLYKIFISFRTNSSLKYKGYKLVLLQKSISPFSFLRYIFINRNDMESLDFESLVLHEIGHIKNRHSLDICLIELVQVFMWFNPFLIFFKREIKLVHEYQADNYAISCLKNMNNYQNVLINQVFRNNHMILASGFNSLFTKNRLKMITKKDSHVISRLIKKTITLSATLLVVLLLVSFNNAEKLNAGLKQSSLMASVFEPAELNGQLLLSYPGLPKVKIQGISGYKVLELTKNGKVHFKITSYGNQVFLIEKEVRKLNSRYKFVLKDLNDKVYQGELDIVQHQEPDIKYYAMYNGEFRRTLKLFDCMAFEGNYPARKLKYTINNEVKRNENFMLNSSIIEHVKINFLGQGPEEWKIEIDTKHGQIAENEFWTKDQKSIKEEIYNSNLAMKKALSKPPTKRKDWETTEYYSQERPGKNIEFHRNGARVIIKKGRVEFMDDGYFKTGPFLVKLEQDKLIVNYKRENSDLVFNSDHLERSNQEIRLNGNSELALNDEFIFKANEIVVVSN